jgi:hypothetical protein
VYGMKYQTFLKILDTLCKEAPTAYKRYRPGKSDHEKLIRARSLAFIHLYLKVQFGLVEFSKREPYITDDTYEASAAAVCGYLICGFVQKRPPRRAMLASLLILYNVTFTMNCSKALRSRPSQIQTLRGSFAFYGSFFGRIAGAFECFATSVRFEGVLATRFIVRIAFGIVRFTFGNFVVFHIIGLVRVNVAFRLSLPRPSHELRRTCLPIFGKKRTR